MTRPETIASQMLGLGWYIRRTPDSVALAEWYGGALGLPLIRGRDPVWFFWGGDALCFELKSDTAPDPVRYPDPDNAPMVPVFAVRDIEAALSRLQTMGTGVLQKTGCDHWVLDPDRQLVVLRAEESPLITGCWPNVGASPFPRDLMGWGWTRCAVPDVESEAKFLVDLCGFDRVDNENGSVTLAIGGSAAPGALLELVPGGPHLEQPPTREHRLDAIIFRVYDHDAVNALLKQLNVPIVNDAIRFNSASLTYIVTPSGRLIGFEERFRPIDYRVPRREFLEDREAIRRGDVEKGKGA